MRPHPLVIAESIAQWGEPFVEVAIFGTADAAQIAAQVDSFCRARLGAGVAGALFENASVGNVHGLVLQDGRRVVLKAHQPTMPLAHLRAVQRIVRHLRDHGFPAPRPLVDVAPLGHGHAWVEEMLDRGDWEDPHRPEVRRAMAEALAGIVRLCAPFVDTETSGLRSEPLHRGSDDRWSTDPPRVHPAPTLEEARAYVAEYEEARGRPFSVEERRCVGASFAYAVAYGARCAHSIGGRPEEGSFLALARRGPDLLDAWN